MIDLAPYNGSLWLCEPERLHRAALRVASFPNCPTRRDLARARRKALDEAAHWNERAILSTGRDDPAELRLEVPAAGIRAVKGRVGVIPVYGMLDQRLTPELEKAGGTPLEFVSMALDVLLADPNVGAIVLDVDSPGGAAYGLEELSDKLYAARAQKPCYSCANSWAASAAYWLATSAATMVATPGADVGSVGVYAMHVDQSKALDEDGIKISIVSAGKYKVAGNPTQPLDDETRAHMQSRVDEDYSRFVKALSRNRGASPDVVRKTYGEGRVMGAQAALAAGMVDRVMSMEQLLGKLNGGAAAGSNGARSNRAAVATLRLRHAQRKRATGAA